MSTVSARQRLLEHHSIPTEGGGRLGAVIMTPKAPMKAERVVIIAPLVGAGAGQQLYLFRDFTRRGAIVISYEYRGHPSSTGRFNLDRTIIDTHHSLVWAFNYAAERGLPLHGFSTCFGTIALLAQFRDGGLGPSLQSIGTISGLYHLNQILRMADFAPIVSRYLGRSLDAPALVAGIEDGSVDCDGTGFRGAMREYLSSLMPMLRVELNSFEELTYDHIDMREMFLQFARADYLDGVYVPPSVPCTTVVGSGDVLFLAHTEEGLQTYRHRVLSLVPHASLHVFDMDHFGRGPGHDQMIKCAGDGFERADTSAVPAPHIGQETPVTQPHHLLRKLPR